MIANDVNKTQITKAKATRNAGPSKDLSDMVHPRAQQITTFGRKYRLEKWNTSTKWKR
jgi:hypothetical protein